MRALQGAPRAVATPRSLSTWGTRKGFRPRPIGRVAEPAILPPQPGGGPASLLRPVGGKWTERSVINVRARVAQPTTFPSHPCSKSFSRKVESNRISSDMFPLS